MLREGCYEEFCRLFLVSADNDVRKQNNEVLVEKIKKLYPVNRFN